MAYVVQRPNGQPEGGSASSNSELCPVGIGAPRVVACDGSGGAGPSNKRRMNAWYQNLGRVRPEVARISVTLRDGTTKDAAIENGWFYVRLSTSVPNPGFQPGQPSMNSTPFDIVPTLRAWDIDGNEVPITYRAV